MAAPQSTALPSAPLLSDSPDQFEEKAFAFVGSLEPFRVDLQAQADFVDTYGGPGSDAETVANIAADVSAVAAVAPDVSLLAVGQVSKTELAAVDSEIDVAGIPANNLRDFIHLEDGGKYRVISAVLRQDTSGSGWYALDDSGHTPIGIDSVNTSVDGQTIEVNYSFTGSEIGSVLVTADESFAAYPMYFGASVSVGACYIDAYHHFSVRTSGTGAAGTGPYGVKGTDWDAVVDTASGTITVTHGSTTHSDAEGWPVWAQIYDSENNSAQIRVVAKSKTGYTLQNYGPLSAIVANTLAVTTTCVDTISAAWDGTDTLTITHPTAQSAHDAQITSRDPRYHAAVRNTSLTSTTVEFWDISTGALFTGGSCPASINFARASSVAKYPITGSTKTYSGINGPAKIPASAVAGSGRNLWLYGIIKVA